jgi:nifR3 family TIM-barrel protein
MAPMAGVTDKPFRRLITELGCGLAFTEMISGKAIQYNNRKTWNMLDLKGENPIGVQLFGCIPQVMADAARVAQSEGATVVDINMGCPVPKIVGNKEGAALMLDPERAQAIVRAMVKAVKVPVTVKIRTGWDKNSINAVPFAQLLEDAGASAITVHGRTREQMYSGKADWSIIGQVARAVSIPVIGNGDIWTGIDGAAMLNQTGCSGIMLARGVMGNPWLFAEVAAVVSGTDYEPPEPRQCLELAIRHYKMELDYRDQRTAVLFMRKHLSWYLKGMTDTAEIKRQIFRLTAPEDILQLLQDYIDNMNSTA